MIASRVAVAAAVLAAFASCTHRAPDTSRTVAAATPPKPAFEIYPPAQIASVKDPHHHRGKALCQRCHFPDLKLTNGPNALCLECHRFGHSNHPVDVVQKAAVKDLPLGEGGKVACHTCHDPHQKKSVLRKSFNELCMTCHARH